MRFVDTNVLIYAVSAAAEDTEKRCRALDLLARHDLTLSVQVLQEFYVQSTRSSRPGASPVPPSIGLALSPPQVSRELCIALCTLRVVQPTPADANSLTTNNVLRRQAAVRDQEILRA